MVFIDDLTDFIYVISIILVLIMIFLERSKPQTIAFWTMILLFVPLLSYVFPAIGLVFPFAAFILYLCFGQTFYSRRQFSVKNLDDEKIRLIKDEALDRMNMVNRMPEHQRGMDFANAMMRAGGSVYTNNNNIKLYTEGNPFFDQFLEDLRNAKSFIHIEFYIIRNDELSNEFMDILIQKVKEGLEVRLMIDAIGNNSGPKKKILEFRKAGGKFTLFHRTITVLFSPRKNNRNHRKIAVIDGEVGYVAGFNIGDEYLGKGPFGYWRDSGVRVEGHGVVPMQIRFFMDWGYASKEHLEPNEKYFPILDKQYGKDITQLISGGPDSKNNPVKMEYLNIIKSAKKTLYIHTPYLVPDDSTMDALALAAFSGVDVRIIMPDRPDHAFVFWNSLWNASELIKRGVRVYQYNRGFVHSKTLVADGEFSSVGSANLDLRSMNLNFETNSMIYCTRIGKEMDDAFLEDLKYCTEYSLQDFEQMKFKERMKVSISRLFSGLA